MIDEVQKFNLITRRQTFLRTSDADSFKALLMQKERPKIVWETAPTGKPHIGYFVPLTKLVDFLRAGLDVTVCYLDVYGFLINYIYPMEQVAHRRKYYHFLITTILETLGVPLSQVRFVEESSLAYSKEFIIDSQKLYALMTQQDARDSTDEVAKTTMLSPMLCAVQQSLSEPYLDVDIQFGGEDQRGLFLHAEKFIPQLGYRKREHLMNVIVAGLDGLKMSSSKPPSTKIEFLDDPETVRCKISEASCEEGNVSENVVLGILRDILIPISELRLERLQGRTGLNPAERQGTISDQLRFVGDNAPEGTVFTIEAKDRSVRQHYSSYDEVEQDFAQKKLHPTALKAAVADAFNRLLAPIRKKYAESEEWQVVDKLAYPDSNQVWHHGSDTPVEAKHPA